MQKLIYVLLLSSMILSCSKKEERTNLIEAESFTQAQIDSVLTEFKFEYTNPVFIDSSDHVLLPITTQLLEKKKGFSRSEYYDNGSTTYWNILFYNKTSGQTRLLTESKLRISYYKVNMLAAGNLLSKSILYEIVDNDYNNDQQLNDNDPEHLFISNTDGSGLRRLSPMNEDMESFTIIPNTDQLIIRTKRDVNGDLKFNSDDKIIWYKIDLQGDSEPVEMVDSLNERKIQNLYFEQWLKKK